MLHPRPRSKSPRTVQYPRHRFEQLPRGDEHQACLHTFGRQQFRPIRLATETRPHSPALPQQHQSDLAVEKDEQSEQVSTRTCDDLAALPAPSCGLRCVLATHRSQARHNAVCACLLPESTNSGDLAASSRQRYPLRGRRYRKLRFHSAPSVLRRLFGAQEGLLKTRPSPTLPSFVASSLKSGRQENCTRSVAPRTTNMGRASQVL